MDDRNEATDTPTEPVSAPEMALNEPSPAAESAAVPDPAPVPARSGLTPLWRVILYVIACGGGGLIGLILVSIPYIAIEMVQSGGASPFPNDQVSADFIILAILGAYFVMVLVTLLFVRKVDRRPLSEIGFSREDWLSRLLRGTVYGGVYIAGITLLYLIFGWVSLHPTPINGGAWIAATLFLYPMIGITEEMVFRGYLLRNLEEWRGRTFAIIITTVLFWMVHIGQGNVGQPLGAATMLATGAMFAFFRYGTRSLWFPIGFHAAYDWGIISLGGIPELAFPTFYRLEVNAPAWLVGPPGHSGLADLGIALLLLGIAYRMYRRTTSSEDATLPHSAETAA